VGKAVSRLDRLLTLSSTAQVGRHCVIGRCDQEYDPIHRVGFYREAAHDYTRVTIAPELRDFIWTANKIVCNTLSLTSLSRMLQRAPYPVFLGMSRVDFSECLTRRARASH